MAELREKRIEALRNRYKFLRSSSIQGVMMELKFECGNGWMPILENLFLKMDEEVEKSNLTGCKVVRIREKFGDLMVSVNSGNDAIDALIRAASKEAAETCEDCGKQGKKREFNEWFRTQCPKCYAVQPASVRV